MVLTPGARRCRGEGVQLTLRRMLDRIVIRSLAVLSLGLQLAEDAFVDTLHEGARAVPNHFGYGVGHVAAMLGIHLLDDL